VSTLPDVYRKFGEASEAAQLLETELGNVLFAAGAIRTDPKAAAPAEIFEFINRQTLGQLLRSLNRSTDEVSHLEPLLSRALTQRNRLVHSFYREHNFRRNSTTGCQVMMNDLEAIHKDILDAYRGVLLLFGVDIYEPGEPEYPDRHIPI